MDGLIHIVNTADFVPELPFSIQIMDDFNDVNPFTGAKDLIKTKSSPETSS